MKTPIWWQRKRVLIPAALAAALLVFVFIRGTWSDSVEKNPTSPDNGIFTQLHLTSAGRKEVRCALLLDQPIERVWDVVTGYERFPQVFPTVLALRSERIAADRYQLHFELDVPFGRWNVETVATHEERTNFRRASWDQPFGRLAVNRGSWTLTPVGSRTLLVYCLDVEVRGVPSFLVRNVLLSRQPGLVKAVQRALAR